MGYAGWVQSIWEDFGFKQIPPLKDCFIYYSKNCPLILKMCYNIKKSLRGGKAMYKFGTIGYGNMGSAILAGAVRENIAKACEIAVFDLSADKREECTSKGYALLSSALEVFENCETVLFAVKPQGMEGLLDTLKDAKKPYPTVISIVAGYPSAKIRAKLEGVHVVRVMPNTPLLLGCGATALAACEGTTNEELETAHSLFRGLGETCIIGEDKMNEIIAVNGSCPAFVYYYIEAIARWGESVGLDYNDCLRLCAKTFEGSAKMILSGEALPEELIARVCSPGGTTLAAMEVLKQRNASADLKAAADACTKRAYELGKM